MRIFVLEDDPDRIRWFCQRLISHDWQCIHTCHRESDFTPPYDVILLDHDLGGSQMGLKHGRPLSVAESEDCGMTFLKMIEDRIGDAAVLIHSYNGPAADQMKKHYPKAILAPFRGPTFNVLLDRLIGTEHKGVTEWQQSS